MVALTVCITVHGWLFENYNKTVHLDDLNTWENPQEPPVRWKASVVRWSVWFVRVLGRSEVNVNWTEWDSLARLPEPVLFGEVILTSSLGFCLVLPLLLSEAVIVREAGWRYSPGLYCMKDDVCFYFFCMGFQVEDMQEDAATDDVLGDHGCLCMSLIGRFWWLVVCLSYS